MDVFAQRNKRRPNRIGIGTCELLEPSWSHELMGGYWHGAPSLGTLIVLSRACVSILRMRDWWALLGSLFTAAATGVLLAEFPGRVLDIPVGLALVIALAVLARTAMRLAAVPRRVSTRVPPRHG